VYGLEWLIGSVLLGVLAGVGGGYLLTERAGMGRSKARHLEAQLAAVRQELAGAQRELDDYRHEVVTQFSETARKFQTLNDSYTDLHQQLARSSGILCGDLTGPLLVAPAGHQDLIPAEVRAQQPDLAAPNPERSPSRREPSAQGKEPSAQGKEPSAQGKEPSAQSKEPSAQHKEPSAPAKEPSAAPEPAPAPGRKPSAAPTDAPGTEAVATSPADRSPPESHDGAGDIRVAEPRPDRASSPADPEARGAGERPASEPAARTGSLTAP
jgi:uncharacterized membrane-anchored protein YhcB (DUF1043 family)